ncbi:peroxiredoxin [Candidatus Dependentiae bacterium]|nr:MAG: peroxiredoxin [Candidatus Dependentiae bacterium]
MPIKNIFQNIAYVLSIFSSTQAKLHIGQKAPDFVLIDDHGKQRSLSLCKGKKVALVFYPADGSPYCTKQAKAIKNDFEKLAKHDIVVFGLSQDSTAKHKAFKEKYSLPFDLLTASKPVLNDYCAGGWIANKRITFLVDEKGVIVDIINHVNIQKHAQQILDGFGIKL